MRVFKTYALAIVLAAASVAFCEDRTGENANERKVSDYFPLEEGWGYAYQGADGETSYTVIKAYEHNGLKGFYLINYDKNRKEFPLFIANGLGVGFYFMQGDDLYTVPTASKLDLNEISRSRAVRLLTGHLKNDPGRAITEIQRGTSRIFYQVTGPETVTVPAGTFKDCMKVTWETVFPRKSDGPPAERAVWLARGVGIVKHLSAFGHVFELVEYAKPNSVSK